VVAVVWVVVVFDTGCVVVVEVDVVVEVVVVVMVKVKPEREAVPTGVVTFTAPLVPLATIAVICVPELTVKLCAAVPPKDTAVAPVKLVPVITTDVPVPPDVGVKEVMVGEDVVVKVKLLLEVAVLLLTTVIAPVVPEPTIAVICAAELTVKLCAAVPPKDTAVAPVKLVPVITTDVPVPPDAGVKEVMVGVCAALPIVIELSAEVTPAIVSALGSITFTLVKPILAEPLTPVFAVKLIVARMPLVAAGALELPVRL